LDKIVLIVHLDSTIKVINGYKEAVLHSSPPSPWKTVLVFLEHEIPKIGFGKKPAIRNVPSQIEGVIPISPI
jgi:hypothetical protein